MDATTIAGIWDNDFRNPYNEPFITDYDMGGNWVDYINDIMLSKISHNDKDMESYPDSEDFILRYDKDPFMLGLRLKLEDKKGAIVLIVVKMPGNVGIY